MTFNPRRQYRFILKVPGLETVCLKKAYTTAQMFEASFYEDEDDPISTRLQEMLDQDVRADANLIFTDAKGNFIQEWQYSDFRVSGFGWGELDYGSAAPVVVEARFLRGKMTLINTCSYKTADIIKNALVCHCGADKAGTTHSGWCPKYV